MQRTVMVKNIAIILFIFFAYSTGAKAQLSVGGYPLDVPILKSGLASTKLINMPHFDLDEKLLQQKLEPLEKSVKFAHSFTVNLTPNNSGEWFEVSGFRVWQLRVKSEGALSLNCIFSKYYLPEGARLFVFDPDKEVILGAFTDRNNKPFKKLAIHPLPGEELVLQYEEPLNATFNAELEISLINHDFLGVVPLKNRWKRRTSGDCNVDVNCETDSELDNQKRAVCRVFAVDELGTGTLLNNTAGDGKPILISAFHVYDSAKVAEITLYDFNYESPFCTGIDGYDNQSISGSLALASFDSLDFMLVELSEAPPAHFMPFYAGWDVTPTISTNTYIIHHPNGDTKKISHDEGTCDSISFSPAFTRFGHWKVLNWETGTTEAGSSGACLFNAQKRAVGTLTGGYASCNVSSYDAFARFDKMWSFKADSSKQLKCWLDPLNSGKLKLDGFDPFEKLETRCSLATNFLRDDVLNTVDYSLVSSNLTEIAERFDQYEKVSLSGVAIGIKKITKGSFFPELSIRVYSGNEQPEIAEKQYKFSFATLTANAMNYFSFGEGLELNGIFFISVHTNVEEGDTVQLYCSNFRGLADYNTMHYLVNDQWFNARHFSPNEQGASLLMEALVCGSASKLDIDSLDGNDKILKMYPNPALNYVTVEFLQQSKLHTLSIYDRLGRRMLSENFVDRKYAEIDVSNLHPGIYIVHYNNGNEWISQKLMITAY